MSPKNALYCRKRNTCEDCPLAHTFVLASYLSAGKGGVSAVWQREKSLSQRNVIVTKEVPIVTKNETTGTKKSHCDKGDHPCDKGI